jgi:uncharacterized protein YbjQ (UPF0145 family)
VSSAGFVLAQQMRAGQKFLNRRHDHSVEKDRSSISGLSINENRLLRMNGWDAIDVCSGAAAFGMRRDTINTWGADQDARASQALGQALALAIQRLSDSCKEAHGSGVIDAVVQLAIEPRYMSVNLFGTAIRPLEGEGDHDHAFTSNLDASAFVQLMKSGWRPLALVSGCGFVRAFRRAATQSVRQVVQNVELKQPTQALARARESTMLQLQTRSADLGAHGVVQMSLESGPVSFAKHIMSFIAWGSAIVATTDHPLHVRPEVSVSLDDRTTIIDPKSLSARDHSHHHNG